VLQCEQNRLQGRQNGCRGRTGCGAGKTVAGWVEPGQSVGRGVVVQAEQWTRGEQVAWQAEQVGVGRTGVGQTQAVGHVGKRSVSALLG